MWYYFYIFVGFTETFFRTLKSKRENPMPATPRSIVDYDAPLIENFVTKYLGDVGIGLQIIEAMTKSLYGTPASSGGVIVEGTLPSALYNRAVSDIFAVSMFETSKFDLERVIDGAASLELLVRYANMVNPLVIPQEVIPSGETVKAALALFNEAKRPITS